MNAYTVLGVTPSATDKEIHLAYRKLAAMYHPDNLATADMEKFTLVSVAWNHLKPAEREKYDARRRMENKICTTCDGKGMVPMPTSFTTSVLTYCTVCEGTGDRR